MTLYWLLTGEFVRDFKARDRRGEIKDPYMIVLDEPVVAIHDRDSSTPREVAKIIHRSLESEPEDRFETAGEMARSLKEAV